MDELAKYVKYYRLSQNEEYYNYDNATAAWSRASNPNVALKNNDNKEDDFTVELQRLKMLQRKEQSGLKGPYDSPSDDDDLDNEEALQSKKIRYRWRHEIHIFQTYCTRKSKLLSFT